METPMKKTAAVVIRIERKGGANDNARVDWVRVDDGTLVDGLVAGDPGAWREFMRRFAPVIKTRIRFVMRRFWRSRRDGDCFEEIKAEFLLKLLSNDMSRLRRFNPKRGTLAQWMGMIAHQTAVSYLMKDTRQPLEVEDTILEQEGQDHQRGAYWVAEGL